MRPAIVRVMLIGAASFAVLSLLEKIPYLGWFDGLVSIGLWAYLASHLVERDRAHLSLQANPSIRAMGFAALVGAVTALAGAVVSFLTDVTIAANAGGSAIAVVSGSNVVGSLLGLVYWPFVGAAVCGLFGLIWGSRLQPAAESITMVPIGTLSPDGQRFWSGQSWEPMVEARS